MSSRWLRGWKATAAAVLACVLMAGLLWLLAGRDSGEPPGDRRVSDGAAAEPVSPMLRGTAEVPGPGSDAVTADREGRASRQDLRVLGQVIDEWEKPVTAGRVAASVTDATSASSPIETEASVGLDGTFALELAVVAGQTVRLDFVHGDRLRSQASYITVAEDAPSTQTVTLVAFRTATIDVTVLDAAGRSVPGATVRVLPESLAGGTATTNAEGRCSLAIVAEPLSALRAETADGMRGQTKALWLHPAERKATVIRLDTQYRNTLVGFSAVDEIDLAGRRVRMRFLNESGWLDVPRDGTRTSVPLPETGQIRCVLIVEGVGSTSYAWPDWSHSAAGGRLDVRLGPRGSVELQVDDELGQPLPNLRVQLRESEGGSVERGLRVGLTNESGVYRWELLPRGIYRLQIAGLIDELVTLDRLLVRHQVALSGASRVFGTFTGPGTIAGQSVRIVLRAGSGEIGEARAPQGEGAPRRWEIGVPAPRGTAIQVQAMLGRQPLGPAHEAVLGDEVNLDVSDAVIRVRPSRNSRKRLRGWLELRPVGSEGGAPHRSFLDARSGLAEFARPPPGNYGIRLCRDAWGQHAIATAGVLSITPETSEYAVDLQP